MEIAIRGYYPYGNGPMKAGPAVIDDDGEIKMGPWPAGTRLELHQRAYSKNNPTLYWFVTVYDENGEQTTYVLD